MPLSQTQIKFLKSLAHHLKPVISVGKAGLSSAVVSELNIALKAHELLKVKLPAAPRLERASLLQKICAETGAEPVQQIGRVAVVFQRVEKPKIQLPS